ncbi:hypothetical protein DFH29DRAFT_1010584 [Suillus ampliporus]|nr:hypothetical protein DFH29DRAFT_1010584 [Suillus ampliporus]
MTNSTSTHQHLGLQLSRAASAPLTPPPTQGAVPSGSGSATQSSAARPSSSAALGPAVPRPLVQAGSSQSPAHQPVPQAALQHAQQAVQPSSGQSAHPAAPVLRQPAADPALQHQGYPPAQPADEITALRARITELEQPPTPQQALVADPAAVDRIRTSLASTKEDSKWITLPILQPGHKTTGITAPHHTYLILYIAAMPPKVEDAFKQYRYVPYTALTHAARSKANLRGEDSSFVFTQDGLTAKGLDHSNELSIMTVDWIGAAKAAEERTLHYWGEDRALALVSHHLVVLDIGRTHNWLVAMHYDVQQRELAHANHEHNLAGLDVAALTIANNKVVSMIPPAMHPISPAKRAAPSDFASSP